MQAFHLAKATATVKTVVPSLKPYRKALLFCFSFRPCQTLPVTAVMFYSPVILESVTENLNPLLQVALIYLGFLAGTLPVLKFGDRLPTRWVPVGTFAAMAAWLGRQYLRSLCAAVLDICFGLYAHCVRNAVDVGLLAADATLSDRCTRNSSLHDSSGVACCVSNDNRRGSVAIEVLQYFRDFYIRNRSLNDRNRCVTV